MISRSQTFCQKVCCSISPHYSILSQYRKVGRYSIRKPLISVRERTHYDPVDVRRKVSLDKACDSEGKKYIGSR
jgi:hypothetical protein